MKKLTLFSRLILLKSKNFIPKKVPFCELFQSTILENKLKKK